VQPRPGNEQKRPEVAVGFLPDQDGLAERAAAQQREILVGGDAAHPPIIVHVVAGIERIRVVRSGRHMGDESPLAIAFAGHEVPKRHEPRNPHDGLDPLVPESRRG